MSTLSEFSLSGLRSIGLLQNCKPVLKLMLAASSVFTVFSCDNYRPPAPVATQYVKVANVNRDTMVVIAKEKSSTTARISFTETLSDTALVRISPDTAFSKHGAVFLLPITKPLLTYVSGLTGDSLFIKYQPYKKPISGNLTIEITFEK